MAPDEGRQPGEVRIGLRVRDRDAPGQAIRQRVFRPEPPHLPDPDEERLQGLDRGRGAKVADVLGLAERRSVHVDLAIADDPAGGGKRRADEGRAALEDLHRGRHLVRDRPPQGGVDLLEHEPGRPREEPAPGRRDGGPRRLRGQVAGRGIDREHHAGGAPPRPRPRRRPGGGAPAGGEPGRRSGGGGGKRVRPPADPDPEPARRERPPGVEGAGEIVGHQRDGDLHVRFGSGGPEDPYPASASRFA